jgi:hypothetical protein
MDKLSKWMVMGTCGMATLAWLGVSAPESHAAGSISGAVTFSGAVPANPKMPVAKNADYCGKEMEIPVLVVNPKSKGVQWTVVYLEKASGGAMQEKYELEMGDPKMKCDFVQHVSAIGKNKNLSMKNTDPVLHNPHTFNDKHATQFNVALSEKGQVTEKKIRAGGVIRLQCDSHVHMNGWILSFDHGYFAVTDENGNFKIDGVPPGKYKLVAWHEAWTPKNWDEVERSIKDADAKVKAGQIKLQDAQLERPFYEDEKAVVLTKEIEVKDGEVKVAFELK